MGLFDFLKPKQNKKVNNVNEFYPTELTHKEAFIFGESLASATGREALNLSAVYSAISTISTTMSKIPFFIVNRHTKERINDNALYNVLNIQPSSRMNASIAHKMIWTWVLTEGEAYQLPIRKFRSNEIEQIIPINPKNVSKTIDENNVLWYIVTLDKNTNLVLRYDELVHLKAMTLNGYDGISPLEYAKETVGVGLQQEAYNKAFYDNYGRPSDYLETVADLSSKKMKRKIIDTNGNEKEVEVSIKDVMREEWIKANTGDKRFRTAILDNGLKYGTVPQITQEQMQFVNSKSLNVEDIARFFDMSSCMFKLGVGKQSYSNNEQGQICYITETIVGKLRQWEQELTLKILTEEQRKKGWVVRGNINAELRGDSTTRANYYDKMRSMGVYNIDEIRELEDMPSIGEYGDVRLIGANSVPLERLVKGENASETTPNVATEPITEETEE